MKKSIIIIILLALSCLFAGIAYADSVTASLSVSGTLLATCEVSTTAVNFGSFDASADVYANGNISVKCSNLAPYVIDLDAGTRQGGGSRFIGWGVVGNGGGLPYSLYKDAGYSEQWGDSGHANTFPWGSGLSDTGNNDWQSHTVYGHLDLSGGWNQSPETYTDTVTVTVYY